MILDLPRFLADERPFWAELEKHLDAIETDPQRALSLDEIKRLHYLYQRASADLARLATSAAEPGTRAWLESLVGRTYGEIHETRDRAHRLRPVSLLARDFPRAWRRRSAAFAGACTIVLAGAVLGGVLIAIDPAARQGLLPAPLAAESPSARVAQEEAGHDHQLAGHRSTFSAMLVANNTRVAFLCLALGVSFGVGTALLLFYNGVILGAVAADYLSAGQAKFLLGWLLPHGTVEVPAFLIAGQAGLVLAAALIGHGDRTALRGRLAAAGPDVAALAAGLTALLLWAAFVESFLSQYHEPLIPYPLKIAFGVLELALLVAFLALAGRRESPR